MWYIILRSGRQVWVCRICAWMNKSFWFILPHRLLKSPVSSEVLLLWNVYTPGCCSNKITFLVVKTLDFIYLFLYCFPLVVFLVTTNVQHAQWFRIADVISHLFEGQGQTVRGEWWSLSINNQGSHLTSYWHLLSNKSWDKLKQLKGVKNTTKPITAGLQEHILTY